MMAKVSEDLNMLADKVDQCGKIAKALVARGLSASDIQLVVKRKWKVQITSGVAKRILAAILYVW
ncbi:MAG: hypothetical protein ACWGQW_26530 [bacterium]